jgi:hypothetical protein
MLLPGRGAADEIRPLPPDEKAFGLTLAEWATAWFQWDNSLPMSGHPYTDTRGVSAGLGQRMPVWFLPGWPMGTSLNRTIFIPAGYGILLPGAGLFLADLPGHATDEKLLTETRSVFQKWADTIQVLEVSVDGVPIADVQRYRVQTPVFTVVLPPGNWHGVPIVAGRDQRLAAAGDGFFLLLPSLPVGKHVIQVRVEASDQSNKPYKELNVLNLIIQEPNKPIE